MPVLFCTAVMLGKQVKVNDQHPLSIRCCARHWGGSGDRGKEEPVPRSGLEGESLRFSLSVAGTEVVRGGCYPSPGCRERLLGVVTSARVSRAVGLGGRGPHGGPSLLWTQVICVQLPNSVSGEKKTEDSI